MTLSSAERLRRFYACFAGEDQVLILINADPDAMASAMAVKRLLWRRVAGVTIAHVNDIQRPDNLSMVRLLGIRMIHFRDLPHWRYRRIVLVDSQPDHHECFALFRPDVLIDHHPESCVVGRFCDVRPKYGATASMLTEYLRAARITPSSRLATALYYAIKTDTADFQRKTIMEDIKAFQYLFRYINPQLERRIENAEILLESLDVFEKALKCRVIRGNRLYAHLGEVSNPDICVQIADFFMRVDAVNWTIVSGIYEKKLVIIFRNDGIRRSAGLVASASFGKMGSAGGHKGAARAEIPLEALEKTVNTKNSRELGAWLRDHVEIRTQKKKRKAKEDACA
ncbi:DHH family phosphoesterase [Desulfobotulus sp.]|jgi:nanoRNase/pAp phosphatase (c-di-AMP/oligoRNAs hydrolase)|uniref:DHH family phosphoesterase n=1 Tax=Desulfobotulus sp. TaxID=1940337 RepID=UPI002A36BF87|nr:DHH family phosphoesterase [Desulfobotulus sp.]MDY0162135.1 DHH family phosphoesterase [Desulfobotulus sp.]